MFKKRKLTVFCITDFWYPKIGGMERSIENLCHSFPSHIIPHVLTGQAIDKPIKNPFSFDVSYFPANRTNSYYNAVLQFIRSSSPPRVIHIFGFSYYWPHAQVEFVLEAAKTPNTGIVMKIPTLGDAQTYLSTISLLKNDVHSFIALTGTMREELINCGVAPHKIEHIPNGVRTDFYLRNSVKTQLLSRRELGLPENRILIGFAGRFEKRKRLDVLVAALEKIPEDKRPVLILTGYQDTTFGAGVDISPWLNKDIKWLKPRHDLRSFYHALDAYVSASEAEGMPNAILEAMSSGLAIIASDIPGHRELTKHECNGLLFPAGRSDKLAECLTSFC